VEYIILFLSIALALSVAVNVIFYYEIKQITAYWFSTMRKGQEVIESLTKVYPREAMDWTLKQPGVYVIKSQGWTKIGYASDVARRLHDHRISNPRGFEIITVFLTDQPAELERTLHARFAARRKRGEWFALSATTLEQLKAEAVDYKGR
jgi:hypothetical protein